MDCYAEYEQCPTCGAKCEVALSPAKARVLLDKTTVCLVEHTRVTLPSFTYYPTCKKHECAMTDATQAEPILQFFAYAHLPEHLQEISKPFGDLADRIHLLLPRNAERSTALRKLLEAKDAAVRARLFK